MPKDARALGVRHWGSSAWLFPFLESTEADILRGTVTVYSPHHENTAVIVNRNTATPIVRPNRETLRIRGTAAEPAPTEVDENRHAH